MGVPSIQAQIKAAETEIATYSRFLGELGIIDNTATDGLGVTEDAASRLVEGLANFQGDCPTEYDRQQLQLGHLRAVMEHLKSRARNYPGLGLVGSAENHRISTMFLSAQTEAVEHLAIERMSPGMTKGSQ
jgi:hypothetical protein